MDPIQKSTKLNVNQTLYMMPQFEKVQDIIIHQLFSMFENKLQFLLQYLSNPPKLMYIPPTEYNDNYLQPKLMSNIEQLPATMICVRYIIK